MISASSISNLSDQNIHNQSLNLFQINSYSLSDGKTVIKFQSFPTPYMIIFQDFDEFGVCLHLFKLFYKSFIELIQSSSLFTMIMDKDRLSETKTENLMLQ